MGDAIKYCSGLMKLNTVIISGFRLYNFLQRFSSFKFYSLFSISKTFCNAQILNHHCCFSRVNFITIL